MTLQATCTFPTLERITQATMTLSHGITPSSAMVTVDFQRQRPAAGGTLSFRFGQTKIDFPDCRINLARGVFSQGRRIQFQVLDRRWKWQPSYGGGSVTGKYNVRRPDGQVEKETEKTPQQLATLLLEAMGEQGFSVSALPNDSRPRTDWTFANPASELARLCDALGCRIVLHLDNRVRVHRKGVGTPLPTAGALTHSYGIDPPERPDELIVTGEESVLQSRLKLIPIAQDFNGTYRHINKLPYRPSRGWEYEHPEVFPSLKLGTDAYRLAIRDVFRLFQIDGNQADGTRKVPGFDSREVGDVSELLPLGTGKVKFDGGEVKSTPAEVFGEFDSSIGPAIPGSLPTYRNTKPGTRCPVPFSVDGSNGFVRFEKPVYKLRKSNSAILYEIPELALEISYGVTDRKNLQKLRRSKRRQLPGRKLGSGARIIPVVGLKRTVIAKYNDKGNRVVSTSDSREAFDREAEYYLSRYAEQYTNVETNDITFAGIVPVDLDGLRQQVTWKVGGGPATTQASTNSEHNDAVPTYERRRFFEQALIRRMV